jgi:Mg2+-importing ATPase
MTSSVTASAGRARLEELLGTLGSSARGLSSGEAERRRREFGLNQPSVRQGGGFWALARPLANPLALILLFASAASASLGQRTDAVIIAAMVILSAAIDSVQTARSEQAVRRLQASVAPTATVLRDGAFVELPRVELVPGDVVRLGAGDLVPADARLLEAVDLHVQQAALTGESMPAEKRPRAGVLDSAGPDCESLVFLGTSVVSGTATAVVHATGARTAFGDVVTHLAERPEETEFERGMREFGLLILKTVVFLVLFILVVDLSLGRNALESLLFSVALAVGLTPEFLPIITTVTLAQGAVQMAKDKVIVKHLASIQNLGSIDVLCSDKTGTLTSGTMSLDASVDARGAASSAALELASVNSHFETGIKSPLDAAILSAQPPPDGWEKVDEVPFDFERRRLSLVARSQGTTSLITKGAPESVLPVCTQYEADGRIFAFDEQAAAQARETFRSFSEQGLRVLAVARRSIEPRPEYHAEDEHELVLVGFLTFADHLRDDVAASIARLEQDGVSVKILTGDNELVAAHVCRQAGIDVERIVLGSEVDALDGLALARLAEQASVFARVSPAAKHRVVRALKAAGHVVGFMGDGINDAPSLHGADVGISVAGAVDVAREASDIVLLEKRLDVLHAGIIAGRRSFGNVLKYLLMGTSSNFGNMFSMAGATLFLPFLPMLPTQLLLNNFLYDLAQISIPTDNVDAVFVTRPQRWDMRLVRRFMLVIGPVSSLYDFLTFFLLLRVFHLGTAAFRTGWFVESLATQTLVLFVIRTVGRPWKSRPSRPLALTTLAVVAVALYLPYSPLAPSLRLEPLPAGFLPVLAGIVGTYLAIVELVKARVLPRLLAG